ncbi:MAG: response regulator [Thermoanaerobaculia bacterium]
MTTRLVLADDHPLTLSGIDHVLASEPGCEVVARCGTGQEALDAVLSSHPDILILDSRMPDMNGVEVIQALLRERSPTRIVLNAEGSDDELIREAMGLGIHGIVLKEMPPDTLVQCVRKVRNGEFWLEKRATSQALKDLIRREAGAREVAGLLTHREQEVLHLLCRGLRNRQIAESLEISEPTVKVHLQHVYEKLHVRGRLALLRYAEDKGLV